MGKLRCAVSLFKVSVCCFPTSLSLFDVVTLLFLTSDLFTVFYVLRLLPIKIHDTNFCSAYFYHKPDDFLWRHLLCYTIARQFFRFLWKPQPQFFMAWIPQGVVNRPFLRLQISVLPHPKGVLLDSHLATWGDIEVHWTHCHVWHSPHNYTTSSLDCWHKAGWVHWFKLLTPNSDSTTSGHSRFSTFLRPGLWRVCAHCRPSFKFLFLIRQGITSYYRYEVVQ